MGDCLAMVSGVPTFEEMVVVSVCIDLTFVPHPNVMVMCFRENNRTLCEVKYAVPMTYKL